jgi:hypothetical protein
VRFSRTSRYSFRHSHFSALQRSSRSTFTALRTLLYHARDPEGPRASKASVPGLSPVGFSALDHSTSELLRTLSMMAASKPTSWLSKRSNILSHLAWISGPELLVWAVSLLSPELSPRRLTAALGLIAFGVWLGLVSDKPPSPSSALPQ